MPQHNVEEPSSRVIVPKSTAAPISIPGVGHSAQPGERELWSDGATPLGMAMGSRKSTKGVQTREAPWDEPESQR